MYKVQTILFNKYKYDINRAIKFLNDNNYKHNKIDDTPKFFRFRQHNPDTLKKQGYNKIITKKINNGIDFIIFYK